MRVSIKVVALSAAALSTNAACAGHRGTAAPTFPEPSSNVQSVIAAALRDRADTSGAAMDVVIRDSTLIFQLPQIANASPIRSAFDSLPPSLVAELASLNQRPVPAERLPLPPSFKVVPSDSLRVWFASGIMTGWEVFRARTQSRRGYVAISKPAFSTDSSRALLYVERHCGPRCGRGVLFDLRANGSSWVVSRSILFWVS